MYQATALYRDHNDLVVEFRSKWFDTRREAIDYLSDLRTSVDRCGYSSKPSNEKLIIDETKEDG